MKEKLLDRISLIIDQGNSLYKDLKYSDTFTDGYSSSGEFYGFKTLGLSFIKDLYGKNHAFYKEFKKSSEDSNEYNIDECMSILRSIKIEIQNDWLISFKKLVSAELFSDFMEMSKYLLNEKYKDPAATIIGSTLEENLRQLCTENKIDIYVEKNGKKSAKKASQMNDELYKASVYSSLQHKSITSWLDLRNNSAHGKYNQYDLKDVELMYSGVLNFITNY